MFQKFVLFLCGILQLKLQWKQVYLLPELNMAALRVKKIPKPQERVNMDLICILSKCAAKVLSDFLMYLLEPNSCHLSQGLHFPVWIQQKW